MCLLPQLTMKSLLLLVSVLALSIGAAKAATTFDKSQLNHFKSGAGLTVNLPVANVFSRVVVEFESLVCHASPEANSAVEQELCQDLSPNKCDVRCSNGTAYAMDDAVSFVTLFIVRANLQCDTDGNTRLQCSHDNTEATRMTFTCPRELAHHLLVKSPFPVKSVTADHPNDYPHSWVEPKWMPYATAILKGVASITIDNEGRFFELTGPDTFPVLIAGLPKPLESPPCHQNIFMAGADMASTTGSRILAVSTAQHYDQTHSELMAGALAWLSGSASGAAPVDMATVADVSPADVSRAADASKSVFVWRVPAFDPTVTGQQAAVTSVLEELGRRLTEGRGLLLFYGSETRWQVVEEFLDRLGLHFEVAPVSDSERQVTLSNRVASRLLGVYKSLRSILVDMAANEQHWDRNPTWISSAQVLSRRCRDDRILEDKPAEFQALLASALCNNRDIVSFAPCTFHPACQDNTCGAMVSSGRPCYNKVPHFGFINRLLNLLTDRPACLSQYDTAGVHPGPVRNLARRIGNFRVRLGKSASPRPLVWDPRLVASDLAYGYGAQRELHSTGLYLPAMTRARVRLVSVAPAGSRVELYVNYNLDTLATRMTFGERSCLAKPWLDMAQGYKIDSNREAELFSPFGGLIHVLHIPPYSAVNYDAMESKVELVFNQVVQAPYVDTKLADASPSHLAEAASSEASPAPWGELRSGFAILGAPRSGFARVDANTVAAVRFLERATRLSLLLGGPPYGHWRLRPPQRINTDVDLQCYNINCRGYSGNPVYLYTDAPTDRHNTDRPDGSLLDGAALLADKTPNSHDVFYHELGHNFSPVSQMFGIENREVAADFLLVLQRRYLNDLNLINSPFLFNRYYDHKLPLDHPSHCQVAIDYDWNRVPNSGALSDLLPALILVDYFGLDVLAKAQSLFYWHYAKEPLPMEQRARAASAAFSNVTGVNLQPVFAFFNYPIDSKLRTGQPGFDDLLAREHNLPAFFPAGNWVANCVPQRLGLIEQRFGGRLVRSAASRGSNASSGLFDDAFFAEASQHQFSRERL